MTAPRPLRRRTPAVATSLAAQGPTSWASSRSATKGVQRAGRGTAWQLRGLVQVCHHRGASVEPGGSSFERRASFWQGIVFVRREIAPHHPAAQAGPRPAPARQTPALERACPQRPPATKPRSDSSAPLASLPPVDPRRHSRARHGLRCRIQRLAALLHHPPPCQAGVKNGLTGERTHAAERLLLRPATAIRSPMQGEQRPKSHRPWFPPGASPTAAPPAHGIRDAGLSPALPSVALSLPGSCHWRATPPQQRPAPPSTWSTASLRPAGPETGGLAAPSTMERRAERGQVDLLLPRAAPG
jgi:hypothetical protein